MELDSGLAGSLDGHAELSCTRLASVDVERVDRVRLASRNSDSGCTHLKMQPSF